MPDFQVEGLDFAIAGAYILMILGIGIWVGRKKKDADGYLLAGRVAIWPVIGFSMMSANLSGTSYVGLAGAGYGDGIAVWNYEWMGTLILVFFAVFILPFYLRAKLSTMPEFLERRYDNRARKLFSGFSVFTAMLIDSAGALFAGALTLQLLFPDIPLWMLITTIAVLGGVYVILGGLQAVMITDTIQGVLLLTVGAIIFFMVFSELGSWQAVREAAPEGGMTIAKPADDDFLPWPGIFTGAIWLGFYYWTTNHMVVQKVLAAKSIDHGRWGALLAGFLQLPLLFLLVLPGTMGRVIYPELEEQDQIWPALVFDFLPIGLRGLALAALIAALMSTIDSVLNGSASLVVNDFVKEKKKDWGDKQLLLLSRALVAVFMFVAAVWAPIIGQFEGLVEYFQSFLGYITMPVVVVFLSGLFSARPPRHAAFWTMLLGIPIGLVGFVFGELLEVWNIQFLYGAGIMLVVSLVIHWGITLTSPAPDLADKQDIVWTRETWRQESQELSEKPFWQNYRYLAAGLVVITIAMVSLFI
jgi:solute:Na+ symporter, SSS family